MPKRAYTVFVISRWATFEAYPASLAFSRVLAQLDDSIRGSDPARVDVGAVLKQSAAFRAVALAALNSLAAA